MPFDQDPTLREEVLQEATDSCSLFEREDPSIVRSVVTLVFAATMAGFGANAYVPTDDFQGVNLPFVEEQSLSHQMVSDPEFMRVAELGWKAVDEGRVVSFDDLKKKLGHI